MRMRSPAMAGQFYPEAEHSCRSQIEQCLSTSGVATLPPGFHAVGGIVPHAGWVCSGAVAGSVIRVLAAQEQAVDTFVVFGAVHRRLAVAAALWTEGAWETPLGSVPIDEELAQACIRAQPLLVADASAHEFEHSIEVEVPFIQRVSSGARLLPVMVPPSAAAPLVGREIAEAARRLGRRVRYLGSTDLTHYGPRYQFTPHGVGAEGLRWAKEINDRRMLDVMVGLRAEDAVREAAEHRNACGAGAVAATIAACKAAGATCAMVLAHTNSNEVLRARYGEMEDAVGYAGVVFGY